MRKQDLHDTREDFEHDLVSHDTWFRHDETEPHHQEMHGQTNPYLIMAALIATIGFVFVTGAMIFHMMFVPMTRELQVEVVERRTDATWIAAVNERKATWESELRTPGWVDQPNSVVRLPMDVAVDLIVAEYKGAPRR